MDRIKRRPDWQAQLKRVMKEGVGKPFAYGKFDGVLFTAEALKAMTDVDVLRGLRGYRSLRGGLKNLKAKGFTSPIDPFAAVLEEIPPMTTTAGDLVAFHGPMGDCMGVRTQSGVLAVDEERGLGASPVSFAVRAFRVPH